MSTKIFNQIKDGAYTSNNIIGEEWDMKRFVTYLYECERGNKIKNVGFIRVNIRGNETTMEVYIRNLQQSCEEGNIYALIYKEEMQSVDLGEVKLEKGQSDRHLSFMTEDILGSRVSLNDIVGIGIRLKDGKYIASCWKDEYAGEITRGEFLIDNMETEEEEDTEITEVQVAAAEVSLEDERIPMDRDVTYERIDISQIRDLPSPNWHLTTNSFLVHGFWNYGYLVLKKEIEEGQKSLSLGVPGIFEKPEAVMAILFGFPNFEAVTQEMVAVENEKNQEAEVGTFGCWFVKLKV